MTGGWDRKLVGAPASATEDSIAASDGRAVPLLVFIWAKVMPRSVLSLHNHIIVMLWVLVLYLSAVRNMKSIQVADNFPEEAFKIAIMWKALPSFFDNFLYSHPETATNSFLEVRAPISSSIGSRRHSTTIDAFEFRPLVCGNVERLYECK